MRVIVEKLFIRETRKDGTPLLSKTGRPYKIVAVKTAEGTWLSGFESDFKNIREGDEIDVEISERVVGDKIFYDMKPLSLERKILSLEKRVSELEALVKNNNTQQIKPMIDANGDSHSQLFDDDIPF